MTAQKMAVTYFYIEFDPGVAFLTAPQNCKT